MGAWFLSFAIANYVGGKIASLTGGHGGEQSLDLAAGLDKYTTIFSNIGFILLGIALLIAIMNKPLQKLMHGVK